MSDTARNLLDHLQEAGYEPIDGTMTSDPARDGWFDLVASGTGTVRVCLYPYDGRRVEVYAFDKHMACEWQISFSPGTPDLVIIAAIEAAEAELSALAGRKVTG